MSTRADHPQLAGGDPIPPPGVPLVCPRCHAPLPAGGRAGYPVTCSGCASIYTLDRGFPDLIVGERFPDELTQDELEYEEEHCCHTTLHYWAPLFAQRLRAAAARPRVLAMGCGVGVEVDLLCRAGFDCVGVDNGNRARLWERRSAKDRLLLANGMSLPFEDHSFDAVFCGCVFPHVGVVGDTFKVRPDYDAQRTKLAKELCRVLRPGGRIFAASPNRLFPLDIFHGRKPGSFKPRWNPPTDPFLLSAGDYGRLFEGAGCNSTKALPARGYWMFRRSRSTLKGRTLALPVRALFAVSSCKAAPFLHGSALTPWIVVESTKSK